MIQDESLLFYEVYLLVCSGAVLSPPSFISQRWWYLMSANGPFLSVATDIACTAIKHRACLDFALVSNAVSLSQMAIAPSSQLALQYFIICGASSSVT